MPPGATVPVGQMAVIETLGAVRIGQVEETESVTVTPQILVARTVEELVTVQTSAAAVKLPLKAAEAPGTSVSAVKMGVDPLRSLSTTTLVSVTSPAFRMVPVKVSRLPGLTGLTGQFWVITIRGVVISGHVVDALAETNAVLQASLPVAVTVLLTEHVFAGATNRAVKFAEAPGAKVATVNTALGLAWRFTTVTLFRVTSPRLLTVPV